MGVENIIMIAPDPNGILKLSSNGIGIISISIAANAPLIDTVKGNDGKFQAMIRQTNKPPKKPSHDFITQ